jgi:hypothetical protein
MNSPKYAPATPDQLADIEARLEADQAEYGSSDMVDQTIRDRAALLALVRQQQPAPIDLHSLLPAVTEEIRNLTVYASPGQLAYAALHVIASSGFATSHDQCQARLVAVQALVDEVDEARRKYGRRASVSGCVSAERLRAALTGTAR